MSCPELPEFILIDYVIIGFIISVLIISIKYCMN